MSYYGKNIGKMLSAIFIACAIGGAILVGFVWFIIEMATTSSIKSKTLIKPDIELVIDNNQVDTFYIYKKQD